MIFHLDCLDMFNVCVLHYYNTNAKAVFGVNLRLQGCISVRKAFKNSLKKSFRFEHYHNRVFTNKNSVLLTHFN